MKLTHYLFNLFAISDRFVEYVSNKCVDDNNDVTRLSSTAKRQHFCRRQRTSSAVLIKSSG